MPCLNNPVWSNGSPGDSKSSSLGSNPSAGAKRFALKQNYTQYLFLSLKDTLSNHYKNKFSKNFNFLFSVLYLIWRCGGMLVDTSDLKSDVRKSVRVRVPPAPPKHRGQNELATRLIRETPSSSHVLFLGVIKEFKK